MKEASLGHALLAALTALIVAGLATFGLFFVYVFRLLSSGLSFSTLLFAGAYFFFATYFAAKLLEWLRTVHRRGAPAVGEKTRLLRERRTTAVAIAALMSLSALAYVVHAGWLSLPPLFSDGVSLSAFVVLLPHFAVSTLLNPMQVFVRYSVLSPFSVVLSVMPWAAQLYVAWLLADFVTGR